MSTTEGEHWERQRNFFHDHLTDLVDGKGAKGFHEVIMDEIQDMKLSLAAKVNYKLSNVSFSVSCHYFCLGGLLCISTSKRVSSTCSLVELNQKHPNFSEILMKLLKKKEKYSLLLQYEILRNW